MKKLKCCGCKSRYPADEIIKLPAGNFHSIDCASLYATNKSRKARERAAAKKVKAEKKAHSQKKRDIKDNDRSFQVKKTQQIFNKYIRLRDSDLPCISCGRYHEGRYDAGHYRTTGSAPELRFHPDNCHKQCHYNCNIQRSGNLIDYRISLIKKIGIDRVMWIEGPHEAKRYTIEELKKIQEHYKQLTKELEQ